jgi:hypothetical protein
MNVSRVAYPAVLILLSLALLIQPAAAVSEPVSDNNINMQEVVLVEDETDDETRVLLEYETSFSVRVGTFLFGSDALEEQVLNYVGVNDSEAEFVSLDAESAEIIYSGDAEDLSPQDPELVEYRG